MVVEQGEIVTPARKELGSVEAIPGGVDQMATVLQHASEEFQRQRIVLDEQDIRQPTSPVSYALY